MADVRIRRGSEAWLELADAMADGSVQAVELEVVNVAAGQYVRLTVPGRPATPLLVADLRPDDPPF